MIDFLLVPAVYAMINESTAKRHGEKLEKNPAPRAPSIVIVLTPPFP